MPNKQEHYVSDSKLTIDGFTPAPDCIMTELGPITALVYGKIWRYWRVFGVARPAQKRIAEELNISRRSVRRHAHALVEAGYLQILNAGENGKPNIYAPTNKITISTKFEVEHNEQPNDQPRTESPRLTTDLGQRVRGGRTESPTIKIVKEDTVKNVRASGANEPCFVCGQPSEEGSGLYVFEEGETWPRCAPCAIMNQTQPRRETKRQNLTPEERKERIRAIVENGQARYNSDPAARVKAKILAYPPDVQDILQAFTDATGIEPPDWARGRSTQAAYWIKGARELAGACGDKPARDVIRSFWSSYEDQRRDTGREPFSVTSPKSLVNPVRGFVPKMGGKRNLNGHRNVLFD